jgi:hypothetical protein
MNRRVVRASHAARLAIGEETAQQVNFRLTLIGRISVARAARLYEWCPRLAAGGGQVPGRAPAWPQGTHLDVPHRGSESGWRRLRRHGGKTRTSAALPTSATIHDGLSWVETARKKHDLGSVAVPEGRTHSGKPNNPPDGRTSFFLCSRSALAGVAPGDRAASRWASARDVRQAGGSGDVRRARRRLGHIGAGDQGGRRTHLSSRK